MKKRTKIIVVVLVVFILAIAGHLFWLSRLKGNEVFPRDTYLVTEPKKTALIIVAHDDDAIGCAGTIAELSKKGWKIHFLTFYGNWRKEDNPIRKKEVIKVSNIQQLAGTDLIDFSIQRSDTVRQPWMPIPYAKFTEYMQIDSVKKFISDAIDKYKPSVLFTLDNIIGGYGHPEHVCISQCAIDVCNERKMNTGFSVKKIYQAVFTRTLNENVLKNNPAFIAAKRVYSVEGSPVPDVEINISNSSKQKMAVLRAYKSQKRNLKKIWPYYNVYPHWIYFKIFNKEYFKVISIKE